MVKTFKEFINESFIDDIIHRGISNELRKEDGFPLTIDGVKYIFSKEFMALGDEYNEMNSTEWYFFAFNKPKDGNIVEEDNVNAYIFATDGFDIDPDDTYDVYVAKEFINNNLDTIYKNMVKRSNAYAFGENVQKVVEKYTKKILYEGHMSDISKYNIEEYWTSDYGEDYNLRAINLGFNNDPDDDILNEDDELYGKPIEMIALNYPTFFDKWENDFLTEMEDCLKKERWKLTEDDITAYGDPGKMRAFVRLK